MMADIPFYLENTYYPEYAASGALPQLQHGKVLVGGRTSGIISYLRKLEGKDLDAEFTEEEKADILAYSELVENSLDDALMFARYGLPGAFDTHTKPALRRSMVFPLKWILPGVMRSQALQLLKRRGFVDVAEVKWRTLAAYRAIETKLAKAQPFLFGDRPCSADAMLYGHLDAALANDTLGRWLKGSDFRLLRQFHRHVKTTYFDQDTATHSRGPADASRANEFEEARASAAEDDGTGYAAAAAESTRRTDLFVALGAVVAFVGIATWMSKK